MMKHLSLFVFVFLMQLQSVFSQQTFRTSTKAQQVVALFSQNESVQWAIPVSQSEKISLHWYHRETSFTQKAGIRTFVGYQGDSFVATLSISKTAEVSGDFTWKENQWSITTSQDGYLVVSNQKIQGECGGCHNGHCDTHQDQKNKPTFEAFTTPTTEKKQIHTDNILRTFRLAVLVDKYYYDRYGSKEAVRNFWSNLEISLNEYYAREIGIRFEIVNRDELIIDSSPIFDGKTAGRIINGATFKISALIGEENYDAGIVIARNSDTGIGGLAGLGRVNYSTSKAKAMSTNINRIIAHELGHLFGSLHTFTTGGTSTIKTEPGNGQSIMSYGTPVNFFSLPSIYFIRDVLKTNNIVGTPTNNQAPVINASKLNEEYILPKETFFQFKIDATDPDGDPLLYAFHQADIRKNNAQFESEKSTHDNTKAFYNHWQMESFVERKYDLSAGKTYTFWLGVNDTKDTYEERIKHPTRYDMYETKVKYIDGIPFKITNFQDKKYKTGEKVTLTWDVDDSLKDYKVRILLSNDFGQTFNYILAPETENDGSHEIVMPNFTIGRKVYYKAGDTPIFHSGLGLIKIEVIDHIAFALTNNDVRGSGGFEIEPSAITFTQTPPTSIKVSDQNAIPNANVQATSTCADNSVEITLNQVKDQNFITRTWTAKDKCGNTASFVQHIEIETAKPTNWTFTQTPDALLSVTCDMVPRADYSQFATNTCASISITHQDTRTDGNCPNAYTIRRVYSVTGCGYSDTFEQVISVSDHQAPVFNGVLPSDALVQEGEEPSQQILTATDNCSSDVPVIPSRQETQEGGNKVIIYQWEASDSCGNIARHTQRITIQKPSPPTPPTGGVQPPTGGVQPPTGGVQPPTGGVQPPTGGVQPPTGGVQPPTGGVQPPTGGVQPPTGTQPQKDLKVYNAISLELGSENYLRFEPIEQYQQLEVWIYNELGQNVYHSKNYQRSGEYFRGYANVNGVIGKGKTLPSGTYFYILNYQDRTGQARVKKGYLFVR